MSRLLDQTPCRFVALSRAVLISEVVEKIRQEKPAGLCLLGLPPGGLVHARTLVKRLRAAAPDVKIAVGRWGASLPEKYRAALIEAGANYVGRTPGETRGHAVSMAKLRRAEPSPARAPRKASTPTGLTTAAPSL